MTVVSGAVISESKNRSLAVTNAREASKESRIRYSRDFLFSLAHLSTGKGLQSRIEESVLSELLECLWDGPWKNSKDSDYERFQEKVSRGVQRNSENVELLGQKDYGRYPENIHKGLLRNSENVVLLGQKDSGRCHEKIQKGLLQNLHNVGLLGLGPSPAGGSPSKPQEICPPLHKSNKPYRPPHLYKNENRGSSLCLSQNEVENQNTRPDFSEVMREGQTEALQEKQKYNSIEHNESGEIMIPQEGSENVEMIKPKHSDMSANNTNSPTICCSEKAHRLPDREENPVCGISCNEGSESITQSISNEHTNDVRDNLLESVADGTSCGLSYKSSYSSMDKVYKFQILLPNETNVHLELRNPEPTMLLGDFIRRVKDEYDVTWRQSDPQKQDINWKARSFYLLDAADRRIKVVVNFKNFKSHVSHILSLQDDDLQNRATNFQDMWDLTLDTDILKELPEEYTFETALADLIDNSLQAVWSNEIHVKHISVDVSDDIISIFDTGPGMDGTGENSIEKWGKMGGSPQRKFKAEPIGGTPPYLKPFFGMSGYGGPLASMKLGRHAIVSSKTKESNKVCTLNLNRDVLNGKTAAGMMELEAEISRTPSFTKVEIAEPLSNFDIYQLQCKLKDIYFPYIQCDEESKSGKTIMPIKFEVNGVDLASVQGGEIAITKLHSCKGPDFVLQLKLSSEQDDSKANARLKCVYFPVVKGKENIERILEGLESEGCKSTENFESFGRVSIRMLGRLLPDARWAWLPFMDLKQKRGDTAELLKRCCMRVKCFIETDAGFNPNPSKTDLAQHNPFTAALKNLGKDLQTEKDVKVEIYRDGNLINPSEVKREYEKWMLQQHELYDTEADEEELEVDWEELIATTLTALKCNKEAMFSVDTRGNFKKNLVSECEVKFRKISEKIYSMGSGRRSVIHKFWQALTTYVEEKKDQQQDISLDDVVEYGLKFVKEDRETDVPNTFLLISVEHEIPRILGIRNSAVLSEKKKMIPNGCFLTGGSGAKHADELLSSWNRLVSKSEGVVSAVGAQTFIERGMLYAAIHDNATGGIIIVRSLTSEGIVRQIANSTVLSLLVKYYDLDVNPAFHMVAISTKKIQALELKKWFCDKGIMFEYASMIGCLDDRKRLWFIHLPMNGKGVGPTIHYMKERLLECEEVHDKFFGSCASVEIAVNMTFKFQRISKQLLQKLEEEDKKHRRNDLNRLGLELK